MTLHQFFMGRCPHCGGTSLAPHCPGDGHPKCNWVKCTQCKSDIRPDGRHGHIDASGCRNPPEVRIR